MQITLKQAEITEALKIYVQRQGLSLTGKSIEVNFTASRGDTGLIATLGIEDIGIPEMQQTSLDYAEARSALRVIADSLPQTAVQTVAAEHPQPQPDQRVSDPEPAPEEKRTKGSLFG